MKKSILKSPFLIGIFLILALATTIILIQEGVLTITRARPTSNPENVQITNVSDTSFTVTFLTELKTSASVSIKEGESNNTVNIDDRDKSTGIQKDYYSHHITIPNLEPQKTYQFVIISDGKIYESPASYMVTTGVEIVQEPPSQKPLYGTVLLPDGNTGEDVLVISKTNQSQTISSVTNSNGSYILPTNSIRDNALNNYLNLSSDTPVFLSFMRQKYSAKITANFELSQNLPIITLNQTYAFTPDKNLLDNNPLSGFEIDAPIESASEPSVISPLQNQNFIDSRPTFSGTGGQNRKVTITIASNNINETVDISAQRRWSFRPEVEIPQGEHEATFDIQDDNGISTRTVRSFSIFPSGNQVTQNATPSATPIFTPTLTPTNTPVPSATPTVSPTTTVSATPIVATQTPTPTTTINTPIPTATPTTIDATPTTISTSTPMPPIDSPGSISSTAILGVFSIMLIVAGAAIFFAL